MKIKQVKSALDSNKRVQGTMRALGIKKIHQEIEVKDCPEIRGMIRKVEHLIKVTEA